MQSTLLTVLERHSRRPKFKQKAISFSKPKPLFVVDYKGAHAYFEVWEESKFERGL